MLLTRNYGSEIEVVGISPREAQAALRESSNPAIAGATLGRYHQLENRRPGMWAVEADVTCDAEIISPHPVKDLSPIYEVCSLLSSAGASVNYKCGSHMNIDGLNEDGQMIQLDGVKRLAKLWARYEATLHQLVSGSRRPGHHWAADYCYAFTRQYRNPARGWELIEQASNISSLRGGGHCALGLSKLNSRSPRVEFRLHQGTLNPVKIINWAKLMELFMNAAQNGIEVEAPESWSEIFTLEEMLSTLNGSVEQAESLSNEYAVVDRTPAGYGPRTSNSRPTNYTSVASGHYETMGHANGNRCSNRGLLWQLFDSFENGTEHDWAPLGVENVRGRIARHCAQWAAAELFERWERPSNYRYAIEQVGRWRAARLQGTYNPITDITNAAPARQAVPVLSSFSRGTPPPVLLSFFRRRRAELAGVLDPLPTEV